MKENQFSKSEKIGFEILTRIPLKEKLIDNINKIRIQRLKKLKTPINLVYYITNKCNLKCSHCFYWKKLNQQDKELALFEIKEIAKHLKHPLNMLSITGGEPFLRNDLSEVCNIFYKYNKTKRINITTNGTLTIKIIETTKEILKNNPKKRLTIFISLDGLENTHEKIRGIPGCYKKTLDTINELNKLNQKNLTIFVSTTICEENYNDIPKLIENLKELNIVHKFNILRDNSTIYQVDNSYLQDFNPSTSKSPNFEILENCYNLINNKSSISCQVEALKIRYSIDMLKNKKASFKCLATLTDAVLFPEGEVSICEPIKPFANIRETNYDFYELWQSEKAKEIKEKLNCCFCLQPCNFLNSMKYDSKTLKKIVSNKD